MIVLTDDDNVKEIISEIFEIDIKKIERTLLLSDLDGWDSVTHLELIITIEKKFNINFTGSEIAKLISLDSILLALAKK